MKHKHIKPKLRVFEVEVPNVGPIRSAPTHTQLVWGISREDALRRARLRLPHGCRVHTQRAGIRAG